ncbi:MAG TPA: M14 family zinc carboxypeptidase [Planctomycetota bacterium]|nr:M14 family zinc carboxypeptidase [Planctomycetota bacterium]
MRLPFLLLPIVVGCSGFHPRDAKWSGASDENVLAAEASASPAWQPVWQEVGTSVQGRALRIARVGRGPRRVLWIGGIHGNEREGRISTAELPRALLAMPQAMDDVTLTILEDCNPDGTAQNTRGNAHGVDLNRNYPADNFKPSRLFGLRPLDQPEARALHDLILAEKPHLVIVAHSWHDDHFINFDGPAEHLAQRFSARSGYRVQASKDIAPTPGSLGSWVGRTLGIPILTLEYHRGREPWAAWWETRSAILDVVSKG